eukprot:2442929-Pleurochrysis_carterae.AAC.1
MKGKKRLPFRYLRGQAQKQWRWRLANEKLSRKAERERERERERGRHQRVNDVLSLLWLTCSSEQPSSAATS